MIDLTNDNLSISDATPSVSFKPVNQPGGLGGLSINLESQGGDLGDKSQGSVPSKVNEGTPGKKDVSHLTAGRQRAKAEREAAHAKKMQNLRQTRKRESKRILFEFHPPTANLADSI